MNKMPDICSMVHLGHELDDITIKIHCLANQLNHGHIDDHLFVATLRQLKNCSQRLETIMAKGHKLAER